MIARRACAATLAVLAALSGAGRAAAQDTTRAKPDSSRADTAHHLPPVVYVPAAPAEIPPGPLPPGSRYTFSRDSVLWTGGLTLADMLQAIPGVYVARGGFFGLPEYISYAGRGAAALEIYWDGVRMLPLGADSVFLDPGHIPLTNLDRIDVEVLPSVLRIYLVSGRHTEPAPRSTIRIMQGRFHTAGYAGQFEMKGTNGLGVDLAADYRDTQGGDAPPGGTVRKDNAVDVNAKVEWLPTPRTGAVYEFRRATLDRDPLPAPGGRLLIAARHARRDDAQFRFFTSSDDEGMGWRADAGLATSSWQDDSLGLAQGVRRAFAGAGFHGTTASLDLSASAGDRWITSELTASGGWTPLAGVLLSGDATRRTYDGSRADQLAHGAVSLYRGPLSITGEASTGSLLEAPTVAGDTAQAVRDAGVRLGLVTRPVSAHVGLRLHDSFQPRAFPDFLAITTLARSRRSRDLVADARLAPWSFLTLDGWYVNPLDSAADFQPPTHGRAEATLRSKFWRTFRSGAFELKAQFAVESWGRGTAGVDSAGTPVLLQGATFMETYIAFQIVGFTAFYDTRNIRRTHAPYVPGYAYPRFAWTFGVQWEFSN